MPVFIFIFVAVLFQVLLRYTVYGRRTYAIGSNEQAARVSGINVERHLMLVYTIAGLLAGLAGIVLSARDQTAQGGMGLMYELQAIAMTVIGGTSLTGGRGSIVGTTLGMVIANAPVVFAGRLAAGRIPFKAIRIVAALVFAAIGAWVLVAGVPG